MTSAVREMKSVLCWDCKKAVDVHRWSKLRLNREGRRLFPKFADLDATVTGWSRNGNGVMVVFEGYSTPTNYGFGYFHMHDSQEGKPTV